MAAHLAWILCLLYGTHADNPSSGYGYTTDPFDPGDPTSGGIPDTSWSGICYARCMARVVDDIVSPILSIRFHPQKFRQGMVEISIS